MTKMKKYLSILACAIMAFACNPKVNPDDEAKEYAGSRASVELSTSERLPAEGATLTAIVHRSPAFTVSVPKTADWLSCSVADSVVTVNVKANTSAVARAARLSVIDKEMDISITSFDVVQNGSDKDVEPVKYKEFSVSAESLLAKADDTSASFTVTSEVPWTVSTDNPQFTADPASGDGTGQVSIKFPANKTSDEINVVITVSTSSAEVRQNSYTIPLKQEAAKSSEGAVKPAPGTVLAEWEFDTPHVDALRAGGIEGVANEDDAAPGNVGNPYVPSNISGNGKLEYYNGSDKSAVSTKKNKRRIGERGELAVYCSWVGDWFTWTAEADKPLAAGTKFQLNFVLRPSHEDTPKYWKCEYLDGDKWVELETISLDFHKDAAGTAEDPKQINCFIKETATLTADTPYAQFRFTCTQNARCYDGAPIETFTSKYVLRFAGKWSDASEENKYLQVPENPKIVVVE